ncbi:hypothetical protein LCGC14_0581860 [marine sediment metagenome]|uniref:GH16 domain-containing protein n=1 Tax=marine sediment metagenome TaxID=412755 RepID=A0A0F9U2F2_9ZZZZ
MATVGGQTPNFQTNFSGRIFRTRMLRDKIGPDDPTYHLLMLQAKRDVFSIFDDFLTTLDNTGQTEIFWTPSAAGSNGTAPTERTGGGSLQGEIIFDSTANNDGSSTLFSETVFTADHRPVCLWRMQMPSSVAAGKFELGFAAELGAASDENEGVVAVKATPTSSGTDYAVIIYDTDDSAAGSDVGLVSDGTDDAVSSVDGSPGITFTTQTYYDMMLAIDEQKRCSFWIDSTFQGFTTTAPDTDNTTLLGLYAFCQSRDGTANTMVLDFVLAWQERNRLPLSL